MTRVALVLNPVSRRARQASAAVESACAAAGLDPPLVLETTVAEPGAAQARYAVEQGCDRLVVAGGDGTVRLVAGVLDAGTVTMGVVPIGTANLFARTARLPLRDLGAAARLALTGAARATDLGLVQLLDEAGERTEHPFLVVTGVGHDAATLAAVRPTDKTRAGWFAYLAPGLRRLRSSGHQLTVTADGQTLDVGPLWSLLAVNAARLPAGARVVPGAELDDGLLHLVLVSPSGLIGWARVARTGYAPPRSDYPRDHRALRYRSAHDAVVVAESRQPMLCHVDGDVFTEVVQARICVRAGAVLVAR